MATKRLPTEKTVVTEIRVQIVDQHIRNNLQASSIAAKIEEGVITGDATITLTGTPLVLSNIKKLIYINSWGPLKLKLTYNNQSIVDVPCQGTFLLYGSLQSIEILPESDEILRLSYIYA